MIEVMEGRGREEKGKRGEGEERRRGREEKGKRGEGEERRRCGKGRDAAEGRSGERKGKGGTRSLPAHSLRISSSSSAPAPTSSTHTRRLLDIPPSGRPPVAAAATNLPRVFWRNSAACCSASGADYRICCSVPAFPAAIPAKGGISAALAIAIADNGGVAAPPVAPLITATCALLAECARAAGARRGLDLAGTARGLSGSSSSNATRFNSRPRLLRLVPSISELYLVPLSPPPFLSHFALPSSLLCPSSFALPPLLSPFFFPPFPLPLLPVPPQLPVPLCPPPYARPHFPFRFCPPSPVPLCSSSPLSSSSFFLSPSPSSSPVFPFALLPSPYSPAVPSISNRSPSLPSHHPSLSHPRHPSCSHPCNHTRPMRARVSMLEQHLSAGAASLCWSSISLLEQHLSAAPAAAAAASPPLRPASAAPFAAAAAAAAAAFSLCFNLMVLPSFGHQPIPHSGITAFPHPPISPFPHSPIPPFPHFPIPPFSHSGITSFPHFPIPPFPHSPILPSLLSPIPPFCNHRFPPFPHPPFSSPRATLQLSKEAQAETSCQESGDQASGGDREAETSHEDRGSLVDGAEG
ncbi:unnamed protein product [Closterium sp. NIES-64]|nr:unnamed protein product [Closterium sp. NIES-64]